MMKTNFLLLSICLILGFGLFHIKYEVVAAESSLKKVERSIRQSKENIHILKAEWAHLNDPARLEKLSKKHLGFRPLLPRQILELKDLGKIKLPKVVNIKAPYKSRLHKSSGFKNIEQLIKKLDHKKSQKV